MDLEEPKSKSEK